MASLAPASPIPVLRHRSWRHLTRHVTADVRGRALKPFAEAFLRTVLVAPVTLARWIALEQPQLLEKGRLSVVIAGAAKGLDSIDHGRWYQMLPVLLGKPDLQVSVTLVGPELQHGDTHPSLRTGPERAGILSSIAARQVEGFAAAQVVPDTVANWWATLSSESKPDLCFAFHPAFEAFGGSWLSDKEGLGELCRAGVPVGCASSGVEELWQDHWLLRQHGGAVRGIALENPFALERENLKFTGRWAALTWTFSELLPGSAGFVPNKPELVRFYLAMEMARPGYGSTGNAIFGFIGGLVPIRNDATGETATLVGMPAGVLLCLESGQVLAQNTGGQFELVERVEPVLPEHIRDFPGADADPVDRFIWACEKFRGYVEPVLLSEGPLAATAYHDLLRPALPAGVASPTAIES